MTASNFSAVRNDMRDIIEGRQKHDGGRVSLARNLIPFLDAPLVHRWHDGDSELVDDFIVRDFVTRKPVSDKGTFYKALQTARRNAILSQVFGYDETAFDNSVVKAALDKALPAAIALAHYYMRDGKLSLSLNYMTGEVEGRKRVFMGVPAADMFDLVTVDADGNETLTATGKRALDKSEEAFFEQKHRTPKNSEELRAFMLSRPLSTSGTAHPTYGVKTLTAVQFLDRLQDRAVRDGVLPVPPVRNTDKRAGAVSSFPEAIAFVVKQLEVALTLDESDEPMTLDMESKLDELAERWAAYRAANPRDLLDM